MGLINKRLIEENEHFRNKSEGLTSTTEKIELLLNENNKVRNVLNKLGNENEDLRNKLVNIIGIENNVLILSQENQQLIAGLRLKNDEIEHLKLTLSDLRKSNISADMLYKLSFLEKENQNLNKYLEDSKLRLECLEPLSSQVFQLNCLLKQASNENEKLRKDPAITINEQLKIQITQLTLKMRQLIEENQQLKKEFPHIKSQRDSIEVLNNKTPNKDKTQQPKLQYSDQHENQKLQSEIEAYKNLMIQKDRDISELKIRLNAINHLESRYKLLFLEREDLQIRLHEKDHKMEYQKTLHKDIEENMKSAVLNDNNTSQKTLQNKVDENEELKSIIAQLQTENQLLSQLTIRQNISEDDINRLQVQLQDTIKENENLKTKIINDEHSSRIGTSVFEDTIKSTRCSTTLNERKQESDAGNVKCDPNLQFAKRLQGASQEIDRLNDVFEEKDKENERLKSDFRIKNQLHEQLAVKLKEMTNRLHQTSNEIKRLGQVIGEKIKENDELKMMLTQNDTHLSASKNKKEMSIGERERMNILLEEKENKITQITLKTSNNYEYDNHINEITKKLQQSDIEIEKLTNLVDNKFQEIEEIRLKNIGLESQNSDLKYRLSSLGTEFESLNNVLNDKNEEIEQLRVDGIEIIKSQWKLQQAKDEILKLKIVIDSIRKVTLDDDDDDNQIDKQFKSSIEENDRRGVTYHEEDFAEFKMKIDSLQKDNERLQEIIIEGVKELEMIKIKASKSSQSEPRFCLLIQEKERLIKSLEEKDIKIDSMRRKVNDYDRAILTISECQFRLIGLAEENQRLIGILSERNSELNDEKTRLGCLNNLEKQASIMNSDRDRLVTMYHERNQELEEYKAKYLALGNIEDRILALIEENQKLERIVAEKSEKIHEWEIKYISLERLYVSVKETTFELDYIKRRYDEALDNTEKADPKVF